MTRSQSDNAYRDWVERRKVEDALSAKLTEQEQARRWHNFQRDEGHIKNQRSRHPGIVMLLKIIVILFLLGIALDFYVGNTFGAVKPLIFTPSKAYCF